MNAPERAELEAILETLDPASRTLIAEALLGRSVPRFLSTELGRYLVGCAQQEYASALGELETVPWWRRRRIQALQNQAWRARSFLVWLRDLVINGKMAEVAAEEEN